MMEADGDASLSFYGLAPEFVRRIPPLPGCIDGFLAQQRTAAHDSYVAQCAIHRDCGVDNHVACDSRPAGHFGISGKNFLYQLTLGHTLRLDRTQLWSCACAANDGRRQHCIRSGRELVHCGGVRRGFNCRVSRPAWALDHCDFIDSKTQQENEE